MYNKLIFFNEFGAGDIFESREFVKAIMALIPANEYYYSHGKNPRILSDIPELKFVEFDKSKFNSMKSVYELEDNTLAWNTWIGRDGKYVLPGIGCTVEKLYEMHNDMLSKKGFEKLPGNPVNYIPEINYNFFEIENAVKNIMYLKGELIFIDNGLVQSMQAENFDFNPIINDVANYYQNKTFICTHKYVTELENIKFTSDIINKNLGFDLPEVSFISLFCSVLIGRNSGPHVHTQVLQNVFDPKKKLLSFTYHVKGSSFVVNTDVKIDKHWSGATNKEDVVNVMKGVIDL